MKKLFGLIIMFFLWQYGCSQGCKLLRDEVDKVTGDTLRQTDYRVISEGIFGSIKISVFKVNQQIYLQFTYSSTNEFSVSQGNDMIVVFEDGSKMTLRHAVVVTRGNATVDGVVTWSATLAFPILPGHVAYFSPRGIASIKLKTSEGYLDNEIRKMSRKDISESLACLQLAKSN